MPTFRHGKNTVAMLNGYDFTSYFNSASTTNEVEVPETTTFGSTSRTFITGLEEGSVALEGLWSGGTDEVDAFFNGAISSDTNIVSTIGPEGAAVGRRAILLNANETSYEVTGGIADLVSISAELQSTGTTGGLDRGVLLAAQTTITSTGAQTSVDNAASSANGGVGHLHVTTNSRDGACTIKIQHSADNSTWADLITFTNTVASTVTSQRTEVAAGTTVNRYLRANVTTFGGSTGSLIITVGFARR